jgi:hypothetical protein
VLYNLSVRVLYNLSVRVLYNLSVRVTGEFLQFVYQMLMTGEQRRYALTGQRTLCVPVAVLTCLLRAQTSTTTAAAAAAAGKVAGLLPKDELDMFVMHTDVHNYCCCCCRRGRWPVA